MIAEDTGVPSVSGQAVRVFSTRRLPDHPAAALAAGGLYQWLSSHGFLPSEERRSGGSYRRDDIAVTVYADGGEVSEMTLEFALHSESPQRWSAWEELVTELCQVWRLALADTETPRTVGREMFFDLLRRQTAWQDFERSFHWPAPRVHSEVALLPTGDATMATQPGTSGAR